MHVATEYIALAAVAAFLLIVLLILLCCLCCRRSKRSDESDGKVEIGFAPAVMDQSPVADVVADGRVATATELVGAGFTPTQLLDMGGVREATKTELLDKGYTKSQLKEAGVIADVKPKRKKQKSLPASFKSKPLKPFDSEVEEKRGKKRPADEDNEEETRDRDRGKKKQQPSKSLDDFFKDDTKSVKQNRPAKSVSPPIQKKKKRTSDEKVVSTNNNNKREAVRDSKEDITAARKSPQTPRDMNQTAFFA
jgi:hypothetical protein